MTKTCGIILPFRGREHARESAFEQIGFAAVTFGQRCIRVLDAIGSLDIGSIDHGVLGHFTMTRAHPRQAGAFLALVVTTTRP